MLTPQVLQLLDESVLCWLATCSLDGQPSVSPKEIFAPFNTNSIIIANIASPNSARNIRDNPRACVSFVNVFTQKGFQLRGSAALLQEKSEGYAEMSKLLITLTGGRFPFKSIFHLSVDRVDEIVAPRYRLFPETSEKDQVASAMHTYGVQPQASVR
ncbi:MAG: pyridoxamine 5'-phosphate oxidase family protein [Phycisphaerales bacterium]